MKNTKTLYVMWNSIGQFGSNVALFGIMISTTISACTSPANMSALPPENTALAETVTAVNMLEPVDVVSGDVLGGGDTTPEGLTDAPRRFVYQVATEQGHVVNVAYVALPPSPVAERQRGQLTLDFHAGSILVGDYLQARGIYDAESNTLTVVEEGDYIKTFPRRK